MPKKTRAQKRKIHRMMRWSRREETDNPPEPYRTKNWGTRRKRGVAGYESSPRSASSTDDLQVSSSMGSSVTSILETIFPFAKPETPARRSSSGRTSSGRRTRSSKSSSSVSSNSIWKTVSSVLGLDENKK
jgi:hypothetical protein